MIHSRPLVMKFGGTSLSDAAVITRAAALVARARAESPSGLVVVVSAMAGVTDHLLALAAASAGRLEPGVTVDRIWQRHDDAVRVLVAPDRADAVRAEIAPHFDDLRALLGSAAILRDTSPAALDAIASTGELVSSRIFAAALDRAGVAAEWVDARRAIVTDPVHQAATPLYAETQAAVDRAVGPVLRAGRVAVLGGFVGASSAGVTTTLGRGGSDFSAAVIGGALHASEIQIWTDVDGMLTADPRVIDVARVVPLLSFGEASELAYFGAKVLHPSTILPALDRDVPVRILNSARPGAAGTLITKEPPATSRPLAAVACKRRITMIEIASTRMLMAHGFLRRVFQAFEEHRTPVDVVTTSEISVSVTVDDDARIEGIVGSLSAFADVNVERDMAILCAVGDNLSRDSRIAARVIGALDGFAVRMVSQAASRRNVTIVLRDSEVADAMRCVHVEFFEAAPDWVSHGEPTSLSA